MTPIPSTAEFSPSMESEHISEAEKIQGVQEKLTHFVEYVFRGEIIPKRLQQRLENLPNAICVSSDELTRRQQKRTGSGILRGIYDLKDDLIYVGEGVEESTLIHECLHYISADPPEKGGIVDATDTRQTVGQLQVDNRINEAMTEMLTFMVSQGELPSRPIQLINLDSKFRKWMTENEAKPAMGYVMPTQKIISFLNGTSIGDAPVVAGLFQGFYGAIKSYLSADKEGFATAVDAIYKGTPWQKRLLQKTRPIERLQALIEDIPRQEGEFWLRLLERQLAMPEMSISLKDYQKYMAIFQKALGNGSYKGIHLTYEYPEDMIGLIQDQPGIDIGSIQIAPSMKVNAALRKYFYKRKSAFDGKDPFNYIGLLYYSIWQGIKLDSMGRKEAIEDRDFYHHPEMQKALAIYDRYPMHKDNITNTAEVLLGVVRQ